MKSWRKKALYSAVAAACAFPAGAIGQFEFELGEAVERDEEAWAELTEVRSTVELGVGYVSEDSFKHGEYSGLHSEGFYPVINFDLYKREPWDSETATYWRIRGNNVGLDSRSLDLQHGNQGDYRIRLEYDQLHRRQFDSTETIFRGAGGTRLQLPEGGSFADRADSLRSFDIKQERNRFGMEAEKFLMPRWSVRGSFVHEKKEGTRVTGISREADFFSPSVLVPEPIDYETNRFRGSVAYTGEKGQAELGYSLSLFENQNRFFTWQDPYAADWSTAEERQFTSAPDSEHHQVRFSGGYNLEPTTRAYADMAIGTMLQDQRFLDTTLTPTRTTAGGEINTRVANIGVTARPMPNLNLNASFHHDDRDNKSPVIEVDGRTTTPYSYTLNRTRLKGDYRLQPRTNLTLSHQYSWWDRTYVAREEVEEGILEGRLRTTLNPMFAGGVVLAREERRGSTYAGAESNPLHPALRQFWLADRDRDRYGVFAKVTPMENLSFGASVNHVSDSYRASELGLTDGEATIYNFDVSFIPVEGLTTYWFYNYEDNESRQTGPTWTAQLLDRVGTAGVGLSTSFLDDRLKVGTDIAYAKGVGRVRVTGPQGQQPMPALVTELTQFGVFGDYQVRKDMSLLLRYRYEIYDSKDWGVDGIDPDTSGAVITMGGESPDYKVHVIAASLRYRF
jgi:MtrB/PioB family decaheme-associated outer membrane protein